MTPQQHARIEALAGLIDFLDLLDGDCDLEPEEDRCAAHDDAPRAVHGADRLPGDPDDAEDEPDRCIAGDDNLNVTVRRLGDPDDMVRGRHDPDCEPNGDEQDTGCGEDEPHH